MYCLQLFKEWVEMNTRRSGIIVIFTFLLFSLANAQQVLQESIDVSVHVIAKLSIVSSTNVDLGTIVTGTNSVLPANSNDPSAVTNLGVGATPGQVVISGAAGERISVNFNTATLANAAGNTHNFIPVVYNGASPVNAGSEVTFPATGTTSNVTLDIGGILGNIPDGEEGTYSTTNSGGTPITFSFTYTSI